jgi:methylmalonyl-CoA mutase
MTDKSQKLFAEFPPVTTEQWDARIVVDLKGQDYEKALIWRTSEGFNVKPYYRQENLAGLKYLEALPGNYPFVRGNKKVNNEWLVRQDIFVQGFQEANKKALDLLNKGVNSLGFYFDCCTEVSETDLATLLAGIHLEACEVNFVCPCQKCNCAEIFIKYVQKGKWELNNISASSSIDPIGTLTLKGRFEEGDETKAFTRLKEIIEKTSALPNFRIIGVNGKFFGNSGSTIVQELAFSLAMAAEYLTRLTEAGLTGDKVAKKIKFNFSISNNYFFEIAKLRAARLLWAQIVKAFRPACDCVAKMVIHCETGQFNKTIYDPFVNMLRTQTEAMSAVLGGADSITVLPFDSVFDTPSEFSERIARNQQILLKEESFLDKIVDPAAGSYYVENLTASIADEAWKLFLDVQDLGGFIAAFRKGFIQAKINESKSKRMQNIALRRENLLGTNQFPNLNERIEDELNASLFQPLDFTEEGADVEPLKLHRGAMPFEALRYKTDVYSIENKRPVAFMLTIGSLSKRKARSQFSCNFFAIAGFEVIHNNGFATVEEGLEAAKAASADIIVLCSSDDEYAEYAPAVAALKGNEILVVAGNPACKSALEEQGIKNFIHVRSNILDELKMFQSKLGI